MTLLPWLLAGFLLFAGVRQTLDKKPVKKDAPHVLVVLPLGVPTGVATKITLRGLRLDTATELRAPGTKAVVKLLSKGKAAVPNQQDANRVGDTQVEAEVTVPAELAGKTLALVVVTPGGESQAHLLLVDGAETSIKEKEPNNGFREAQPIQVPQIVDGTIDRPQDVDVYRFEGKAGQAVVIEVLAARHGSALDSLLLLHDADGRLIASNDDAEGTTDSRLEVTLPRAGKFYVTVMDANDQGGPAHVYRLVVRAR